MAEQTQSSVTFTVPDFTESDGVRYSEIQIVVQMEDIRDAARLADALQCEAGQ
jgi:hypothetical protein